MGESLKISLIQNCLGYEKDWEINFYDKNIFPTVKSLEK